jgi:hypothetical protein
MANGTTRVASVTASATHGAPPSAPNAAPAKQPGEQSADRITLNLIGKDKGIAPMARVPHHLEIELPNDYSITVKDPENGAMYYDAKIGMMDVE